MRKRQGLSFLELMLAMSLTFLAISFLMGSFVTAIKRSGQSRHTAVASAAAQSKIERLGAMAPDSIVSGSGKLTSNGEELTYQIDVSDAGDYDGDGYNDPDLKVIRVTMTAADGATASLTRLKSINPPFYGVACGASPDGVFYSKEDCCVNYPMGAEDAGAGTWPCFDDYTSYFLYDIVQQPAGPDLPNGGHPGAVACNQACTRLWTVDYINNGIRVANKGTAGWSAITRPAGLIRPTGLACDGAGDRVFLMDEGSSKIYIYDYPSNTWSPGYRMPAPNTAHVKGLACDGTGSRVWAVDADHDSIRRFDVATRSWSASQYTASFSNLRAVAVTQDGSKLFAMDDQRLHFATVNGGGVPVGWSSSTLLSKHIEDVPAGLACNATGTVVWGSAKNGLLCRYDVAGDYWDEFYH